MEKDKIKKAKVPKAVQELQKLYEDDKLRSPEGYTHITRIIKSLLMKYLINSKGGYYKEGEKQSHYTIEEVLDCYVYIMDRIYGTYTYKLGKKGRVVYDPSRMNLASFVHTWTRGFSSDTIKKQQRRYKKNSHRTIYLEDVLENSKTPNKYKENFDTHFVDSNIEIEKIRDPHWMEDFEQVERKCHLDDDDDFYLFFKFVSGVISSNIYITLIKLDKLSKD